MNLNETVLQKAAEWQPPGPGRQALLIPHEDSGWAVHLTIDRHDEVGTLLWEISLRQTKTREGDGVRFLRTWAAGIAKRVTGLLDPLTVVEIDSERSEGLLRSEKPTCRGDVLYYFEILLKGPTEALVRRYRGFQEPKPREQIAFAFTYETLARVVSELAETE